MHLWHTSDGGGGGGGTASSAGAASWDGVGGADASDAAGFLQWRAWDRKARSELKILGQHGHWILPAGVAPSSVDSALGAGVVVCVAPRAAGCDACMVAGASSAVGASMASVRASDAIFIARPSLSKVAPRAAGCDACMVVGASSADCMVVGAGSAAGASMASVRACAATFSIGPRLVKCRC